MLPTSAERNMRPVAVVEKLYGSLVMISETAKSSVSISISVDVCARRTCVERNDAGSATESEDYTSLLQVSHMSDKDYGPTYQYNIRECEEKEWPLEVLPVGRLVLWLIVPQPELLQQRTLFIPR